MEGLVNIQQAAQQRLLVARPTAKVQWGQTVMWLEWDWAANKSVQCLKNNGLEVWV